MTIPIEAGYSVLGWNHPGFAGSTVCEFLFELLLIVCLEIENQILIFK